MDISKLNVVKIERHVSLIQEYISELRELSSFSKDEFLSDKRNPAAAESFLRRAIEAAFDIGRHILAKTYGLKDLEYKKVAVRLAEKGIISEGMGKVLIKIAGYRNRMVHMYHLVSPEELYSIISDELEDLEKYCHEIMEFLNAYRKHESGRDSQKKS